ncbi:OmpA family protein, partial [Streptomyces sp. SID7982]|nr:OmpA family protein [Streptomyces sp. SID7982]
MKTTQRPRAARSVGQAVAVAVLIAGTTLLGASPSYADDGPSVPPGTEATSEPPVPVDPNDPDLKMP